MSQGPLKSPLRDVDLGPLAVEIERRADGTLLARSPFALPVFTESVTARLDYWAAVAPQRSFLAERDGRAWRHLTFAEARADTRALGQALLARGLSAERPLVILSENSIAHARLALASLYVGTPYAPISPAYSVATKDFARLKRIIDLLTPGLVFAEDGERFGDAIAACVPEETEVIVALNPMRRRTMGELSSLLATIPGPAVDAAHNKINGDTIAKILFTSGSTTAPKAVITTHRMLSANQTMIGDVLRFLRDEPPVLVDWLPWHHSFGGNHNFGIVLHHGGTLYIDKGRPTDDGIAETVDALREIAPTVVFNVPQGHDRLLPFLARDRALAQKFFSALKLAFFAGAALSETTRAAFDDIALRACGTRIRMMSGFGATETAPSVLFRMEDGALDPAWPNVGLPLPGLTLKLAPLSGTYEARVKGPNVTPGYWRDAAMTRSAFDDEGFYRLGDALRLVDERHPQAGFVFTGRLDEDFKLASGTTVHGSALRARILPEGRPYIRDLVLAGENRQSVAALIFPDLAACRALIKDAGATPSAAEKILMHPAVRQKFSEILAHLLAEAKGTAERIALAALLAEPPSPEAGEITDKGTLNRRAVLEQRAAIVEALYAGTASPFFIESAPQSSYSPWAAKDIAGSAAAC
ncbi:MAG: feruloyl-CoA synthase [Methylovirgula sp.]